MMLVNIISITARKPAWPILPRYALLALASVAGSFIGIKLLLMPPSARLQPALTALVALYLLFTLRPMPFRLPETLLLGLAARGAGGAANAMSPIRNDVPAGQRGDNNEIAQAADLCFALAKRAHAIASWLLPTYSRAAVIKTALLIGVRRRQRRTFAPFRHISLLILALLAV